MADRLFPRLYVFTLVDASFLMDTISAEASILMAKKLKIKIKVNDKLIKQLHGETHDSISRKAPSFFIFSSFFFFYDFQNLLCNPADFLCNSAGSLHVISYLLSCSLNVKLS